MPSPHVISEEVAAERAANGVAIADGARIAGECESCGEESLQWCGHYRWVECGECGHINHGHAASEAGYEYDGITQCQACGEVKIRPPKGDIPPVVKEAA